MTGLEEARQQVIDAARKYIDNDELGRKLCEDHDTMVVAVRELDALEQPDPWELLRDIRWRMASWTTDPQNPEPVVVGAANLMHRIDAALAWREAHPDQH